MPIYEVQLRGFDPKEDAQDGATWKAVLFCTSTTDHTKVIEECISERPFSKEYVFWNPKLSSIIRTVEDCKNGGYDHTIRHEVHCKNCKQTFRGKTHNEAVAKWEKHLASC